MPFCGCVVQIYIFLNLKGFVEIVIIFGFFDDKKIALRTILWGGHGF